MNVTVHGVVTLSTLHVDCPVPYRTLFMGKVSLIFPLAGILVYTVKLNTYSVGLITYGEF